MNAEDANITIQIRRREIISPPEVSGGFDFRLPPDLEQRLHRTMDLQALEAFTFGTWARHEEELTQRNRAFEAVAPFIAEAAGSYDKAVEYHYLNGGKHPDDLYIPLDRWDGTP